MYYIVACWIESYQSQVQKETPQKKAPHRHDLNNMQDAFGHGSACP